MGVIGGIHKAWNATKIALTIAAGICEAVELIEKRKLRKASQ